MQIVDIKLKKLLSLLVTITLIGTSTTSLVACNISKEYTQEKLSQLKAQNKINTKDGILEGIAPQEKPFNTVDNKGYFVVWRGSGQNNITDGRIIKFKHNELKNKTIDSYDIFKFNLTGIIYGLSLGYDIGVENPAGFSAWGFQKGNIKSVYRGNSHKDLPNLSVDNKNSEVKIK